MEKALGSKININSLENMLAVEYMSCVCDIVENEKVQRLDEFEQHCHTSRLQHSLNVSYYSFLICRFLGWDYRSAARAGLLHDLYLYDWRTKKVDGTNHAAWHPRVALDNARKITEINKVEKDAILKHMWPCTLIPPRYRESYVVTFVDKVCAMCEVTKNQFVKYVTEK